jgi:hypothetical protein
MVLFLADIFGAIGTTITSILALVPATITTILAVPFLADVLGLVVVVAIFGASFVFIRWAIGKVKNLASK